MLRVCNGDKALGLSYFNMIFFMVMGVVMKMFVAF